METMLANISHQNTPIPNKRFSNWIQPKNNSSPLPIRSHKQLALVNNLNKDIIDTELIKYQTKQKASKKNQEIQAFRETLPIHKLKEELLKIIAENQVVVVSGDTGLGKTTQLPQFILDEAIENETTNNCNIVCTQPCQISAISMATRVAIERCELLGLTVGYQLHSRTKMSLQTKLLFCTTSVLLQRLLKDPIIFGVSHIIVDEIHERGMNEDILLIAIRELLINRLDLKVVLMSATFNANLFSSYFGNVPMVNIPGFLYSIKDQYLEDVLELTRYHLSHPESSCPGDKEWKQMELRNDPLYEVFEGIDIEFEYKKYSESTQISLHSWTGEYTNLHLIEALIQNICRHEENQFGSILVFLSNWDEISQLLDLLKTNALGEENSRFLLLPLHKSMPTIDHKKIFSLPPPGVRKIILATNIAETSITIEDVVYVIDSGKIQENNYDSINKLACSKSIWIAKSNALQRRGRAGRIKEGICYRLYPKILYDAMFEFQLPEILRITLPKLCLHLKHLHFNNISSILQKTMEPPEAKKVEDAIEMLKEINALDEEEELTPLGTHLATLPVEPKVGKILLFGALFQCLSPSLTLATIIAYQNPFVSMIEHLEDANEARSRFAQNDCSDHIAIIRAYNGWQESKLNGSERNYCWDNYLSMSTLQKMEEMRHKFMNILIDINFIDKFKNIRIYNKHSQDMEMVKAILCASLFPNVAMCKMRNKSLMLYTNFEGRVEPEPTSIIARINTLPFSLIVYTRAIQGTLYLNDLTNVANYTLLMFGGTLTCHKRENRANMLGGFLNFSTSKRALKIILELRRQLMYLLNQKLMNSMQFDIHLKSKSLVSAILELIHSNNTSFKNDGLHGASWGQEEGHIYSNANKHPLRRYPSPKKKEGRLGPLDNLFGQLVSIPTDSYT